MKGEVHVGPESHRGRPFYLVAIMGDNLRDRDFSATQRVYIKHMGTVPTYPSQRPSQACHPRTWEDYKFKTNLLGEAGRASPAVPQHYTALTALLGHLQPRASLLHDILADLAHSKKDHVQVHRKNRWSYRDLATSATVDHKKSKSQSLHVPRGSV